MSESEFIDYWNKEYPEAFPIQHELKWIYQDRWLRVHSLPESKRYAESENESKIILERQNQLIEDLIGEGTEVAILFGLYTGDISNNYYKKLTNSGEFQKVMTVDLYKERPKEYEKGMYFDIHVKLKKWQKGKENEILRAVADDEIRAMFISPSRHCIVAPYDGGVDIIVNSNEKLNELKLKYQDWLSEREDGL